ncbi:iron-sulfur cluster insertion protein [Skermanella aerolata]|jgi:iron-sulfur cluster insertion protein|uniref:Heme biosynthesis protein HemY n=1 Tax=Skermanella aerolata TaxID=393310 RepID=A0A512DHU3_9PROT|nr:iron-sulfur cluster insertion protein ErpA [Skermanella aerolata]KJB90719.1 heme biosynthesis protein HemY [Skermanella aerolata KACC 11604]GEO36012.1 heme biosynthesis protein HemY [Skermanella aerolata]
MADTALNTTSIDPVAPASLGARAVTISDSAAKRVLVLRGLEGDDSLMLRITVSGGGCSGFQYGFSFDNKKNEDDYVFEHLGIGVITDDASLDLLNGSVIDFVEDLMGASFQIRNPNATASCGCGSSFAV